MAIPRGGRAKPSRRCRARKPRDGMAAPCRRGARQAFPASGGGNHARRTPRRNDAGGESRRRSALDPRQRYRGEFAGAAARKRRAAQAPSLIEPVVKAIDAALTALEEARLQLEQALQLADYDPQELEKIEERLF